MNPGKRSPRFVRESNAFFILLPLSSADLDLAWLRAAFTRRRSVAPRAPTSSTPGVCVERADRPNDTNIP